MARVLRVGVIGAGNVVERYHLPVLSAMSEVRVEWLCDRMEPRARGLAALFGVRRAFSDLEECPDVEVVLIAIPVGFRRPVLERAFRRGWHAFCEKPFAISSEEHSWILDRAKAAGVQVGVGLMRRFYPATALARHVLSHRPFGAVREVWASEGARQRGTGRDSDWYQGSVAAAGGGVLIETGVHIVDQVLFATGAEAFEVGSCAFEWGKGLDYEARALGALRLRDKAECRFGIAVSRINDLYNGIVVHFDEARMSLGLTHEGELVLTDSQERVLAQLSSAEPRRGQRSVYTAFAAEWSEFIRQCRTRVPSLVDGASAVLTTEFVEVCYKWAAVPTAES